ncbi:hypothetical protein BC834DRAFT_967212 [Gloeopeniophorella convolvens]|nr:hypothetical protein BC834DRAFT_967212 [Gloeopeniophorella convolvens]
MGILLSCCKPGRRRARRDDLLSSDPERRSLLRGRSRSRSYGSTDSLRGDSYEPGISASRLVKLGDALGALKASKYPSQHQLVRILRLLLSSELLRIATPSLLVGGVREDPAGVGDELVVRVRELIEASIQVGLEKNGDDTLQQLLYDGSRLDLVAAVSHTDVHMNENGAKSADFVDATSELPSGPEVASDATELFSAIKEVAWLLIASAAFRIFLSDALLILQELTATAAVEVENAASQLDVGATQVEAVARSTELSLKEARERVAQTREGLEQLANNERVHLADVEAEASARRHENLTARIQDVIASASDVPRHRRALQTILALTRKYFARLSTLAATLPADASAPELSIDPRLQRILDSCQTLLERCACGRPLTPFLHLAYQVVLDLAKAPASTEADVRAPLRALGGWADRALAQPGWARSQAAGAELERAMDDARRALRDPAHTVLAGDCHALVHEFDTFARALAADRAMRRLALAADGLTVAAVGVGFGGASRRQWQRARRTALLWWLPRALALLRAVPLPRVAYDAPSFAASLAAPATSAASLSTGRVLARSLTELQVDPESGAGAQTSERVRVRVENVRADVERVVYAVRLKRPFGYADEGLLSASCALGVDVTLVVDAADGEVDDGAQGLFRVEHVAADIRGLRVVLADSTHWVLNALLVRPLARVLLPRFSRKALEQQLRDALGNLSLSLGRLGASAEAIAAREEGAQAPGLRHYALALLTPDSPKPDSDDEGEEDGEEAEEGEVTTTTALSLAGIAHTTEVRTGPGDTSPTRTTLALGVAPDAVRDRAGAQISAAAEGLLDSAAAGAGAAREAERRRGACERAERRRRGWQSNAFDF